MIPVSNNLWHTQQQNKSKVLVDRSQDLTPTLQCVTEFYTAKLEDWIQTSLVAVALLPYRLLCSTKGKYQSNRRRLKDTDDTGSKISNERAARTEQR